MAELQIDVAAFGGIAAGSGGLVRLARRIWNLDPADIWEQTFRLPAVAGNPIDTPSAVNAVNYAIRHVIAYFELEAGGATAYLGLSRIMRDATVVAIGERVVTSAQPALYLDTAWPLFGAGNARELRNLRVEVVSGGPTLCHVIAGIARS